MDKLLRLRNWQVFVYLVIIPPFFPDGDLERYCITIWALVFVLWILKINKELYNRVPHGCNLNFNVLLINLLISTSYLLTILLIVGGHIITNENYQDYGWKIWIYAPMDLYCLFTFFYSIRFTAKAIASIENNKSVDISYYWRYITGLFVFPIGIWWIQPKINKILSIQLTVGEQ